MQLLNDLWEIIITADYRNYLFESFVKVVDYYKPNYGTSANPEYHISDITQIL